MSFETNIPNAYADPAVDLLFDTWTNYYSKPAGELFGDPSQYGQELVEALCDLGYDTALAEELNELARSSAEFCASPIQIEKFES